MKKFLFFVVAAAAVFVACDPNASETKPAVSFESALPLLDGSNGIFKVVVNDYAGTDPITIPVSFGGSAVKDTDYKVSAEAFVVGGESPVTEITVTPFAFSSGKDVTLTLELPEGFMAGKYPMASFTFGEQQLYASFAGGTAEFIGSGEFTVNVFDGNGQGRVLENGAEIAVEVDTQNSTAIEGTHFNFVGGKKAVVVAAGKRNGTIAVETVGDFDAEHNTIVLKLADDRFSAGDHESVTIEIKSYWAQLDGTWQISEFITDKAYMMDVWYCDETQFTGYPELNTSDKITIDIENGKFTPNITSNFKNYFIDESDVTNAGGYSLKAGMGDPIILQMIELDNVDRNFSATSDSELKDSYIGVRVIKDETTQEDILDMYLIDYKSTDFLTLFEEYTCWNENRPTATMSGVFLNLTFKRVTE